MIRKVIGIGLALVCLWFVTAFTASLVLYTSAPELALALWPTASAQAAVAATLVARKHTRAEALRARALAIAALGKEPANAMAARALSMALLSLGDRAGAERVAAYTERVSRRDLANELMQIEFRVEAGDVKGALIHYDHAMRTSTEIRPQLLPILVQATADPALARSIADLAAPRPAWWPEYIDRLTAEASTPTGLAYAVGRMHLNAKDPYELERLQAAVRKLVDLGAFDAATSLYAQAVGMPRARALLRDGGFESASAIAPLDWELADTADQAGTREQRAGAAGQFALTLTGNVGGEAARQLLRLGAGRYRLTASIGSSTGPDDARAGVSVTCSGAKAALAAATFPMAPESGRLSVDFAIPAGCSAQWLSIKTASSLDSVAEAPWIDDIAIARLN